MVKKTTRRYFLARGLGALGATSLGAAAIAAKRAHSASVREDITARTALYKKSGFKNPESWAKLSRIYNLDPINNTGHNNFVVKINEISSKVGVAPENVLYTIASHNGLGGIAQRDINLIRNKLRGGTYKSKAEQERINKVLDILNLAKGERNILRLIRNASGSTRQVRKLTEQNR